MISAMIMELTQGSHGLSEDILKSPEADSRPLQKSNNFAIVFLRRFLFLSLQLSAEIYSVFEVMMHTNSPSPERVEKSGVYPSFS